MKRPTDEDRVEALQRFLVGLERGDDANQLSAEIADLHVRNNTFPGEVFMELTADALDLADTQRADGVVYRDLLSRHLPEVEFRSKEHRRIQYAVLTPFAVRAGLEPDLLDEVTYWIEQYWQYALFEASPSCASAPNDRARHSRPSSPSWPRAPASRSSEPSPARNNIGHLKPGRQLVDHRSDTRIMPEIGRAYGHRGTGITEHSCRIEAGQPRSASIRAIKLCSSVAEATSTRLVQP